ncbi:transposase [Deinococcus arcticus]|uniref:Transposase n=1 Tax=Deinococcus arcticus TaxID=2136176 RepID=A0A2T3W3S0_9DEIO|nr:hypothetical protein C8263_17345 [Deinococcus arcticus]
MLLPQVGHGRPWLDHCPIISGIIWVRRTGASWRDVPAKDRKENGQLWPAGTGMLEP